MDSPSPTTSTESIFLEDFGQKVDLTRRIREVLLNYPEGTTVLKELIQNADDAGATTVRLCLDRRHHSSSSLLSPSLSQFQGPALLSFNDAVFTDEDFVSISRIGGSAKHGQKWKTGRFGVGFNSVYHLTDLPSFVSGNYVVIFDPQGAYLPNVSSSNPGKRIDFVSTSALSFYKDQFSPYVAFGCDMRSAFKGTMFRFPLRSVDQASSSKLSRQAYLCDDVLSMFTQLFEEGVLCLLFLKSLLSIEMYLWDTGDAEPRKMYLCCVGNVSDDIVRHRQAIFRMSKKLVSGNDAGDVEDRGAETDGYAVEFLSEETDRSGNGSENEVKRRIDKFYLVQSMASANSRIGSFSAKASTEYDIHLLPWASVAACMSDNNDLKLGRAFCFLPLPVRTGLSVQINGYFEVSSNRRGIWYGDDMDRSGKIRSVWNRLLLEDIVAPCFKSLLVGLQGFLGPTDSYYSIWPTGSFEEPWDILVRHIYRNIGGASLLHCDLEGGKWITPIEAFLHDEEFSKSKELGEALLEQRMPIVHLPPNLFNMFLKYSSGFQQKVVTPETVRGFLRVRSNLVKLSKSHRLVLLEYCLEDLIDTEVATHVGNLPLLPLANGEFGLFSESSKGDVYFICDDFEYVLLEQILEKVIDRDIPQNIQSRLCGIAESLKANVVVFSIHYLLMSFSRFVPAVWKYKDKVSWNPESSNVYPRAAWFKLFWQYLQLRCEKLSLFGDWPILPSTSGHLYRPTVGSKLIDAQKLPTSIRDSLSKMGCKILDPNYGIKHPELSLYVCDANYVGVLEAIFDAAHANGGIMTVFLYLLAAERHELRRFLLDPKWYMGAHVDISAISNCKKLPIYEVHSGGSFQDVHFSDLENLQKYLPPLDAPEKFLDENFILSSSDTEEEILLRYYGIEKMGNALFYKKQVLKNIQEMDPSVRDPIMLSILQNLPQLCVEDASFRECLRNLEFVPTFSGSLKRPSLLYDPRNEELYALLEDSDSFPCNAFQEPDVLDMLHRLGLRTSVSPETIIASARHIEWLMHEDQQKAHARGKVLLSYLEVNAMKWLPHEVNDGGAVNRIFSRPATAFRPRNLQTDLEMFWNDLRMICWCPVMLHAPFQTLPWPVVSSTVAPPKLVRLQADMWLVSASMRIMDGECSSTALKYNLGWLSPPGGSAIAAQLLELGKNNEIVNNQVLRQELALEMPRIYSIMMSLIGSDEMDIVKAILEGSRWIWVGDGFAMSDEVVLDGALHLAPYIRVIPVDLAAFKELFLELGIREYFKPIDYANILNRMAARKGSSPLDAQEIRAAILIVQHLAEIQFYEQEIRIYLPDVSGRLFPASGLVYNDAPWLLGSDDDDSSFGNASAVSLNSKRMMVKKFVHGNISNEVAEKLGVCSLRRIMLAQSADSMNLSLSGAAEAFGQHEALTTRLKHILEMYADGPGILFELVQNAEDAGASEVIFLLDKTQYGTSSVLSPEMADWQGPALYCFNDSIFSPQDLYAISRIGQESKLEKPFAIGRFGLGFNCVYHFTDIPTFVSGENIVMFDPHASNLPGISPSHPGLRIKFVGRNILEQFPDQFSPFLHFGCNLQHPFNGTLFRFPLRSASVALRSQIKKEGYAPEDVMSLFASFSGVVSDALLFLRSVKKISLFMKEGTSSEMQLVHQVDRNSIELETEHSTANDVFSLVSGSRSNVLDKDQLLKKLTKSIDRGLPHKCQKIVVTEQNPDGGMLHCWVTSESLRSSGRPKNLLADSDNAHKSIPWACVAAYVHTVHVDGDLNKTTAACTSDIFQVSATSLQNRKNFEGRAFCFLPLPISTNLPVHINSYFELSSNRRDIWFGNDMAGGGKKRSDWNIYILEDVAAPAYGHLLEKMGKEIGPCDLFFSYWPTTTGVEPWTSMVHKLYIFISETGLRLLYTKAREGQWISAKQALFPDFSFHKAPELGEALSVAGLPLVTLSRSIVDKFKEACPSLNFLTPQLLRTLLIRRRRVLKDRIAAILILEYCLLDLYIPVQPNSLYGLALLPLADGSFATFEMSGAGERIYIARGNENGLLKDSIPHQLVDDGIPDEVHQKLCSLAESGKSNVTFLSSQLLEKLFLKLLPIEWQLAKRVNWSPGHGGHPSVEWMRLLWSYLKLHCDDLSIFSKWPILPVGDNYLMQLVTNSNVIRDEGWSENMSTLLLKVGCLFIRCDFPIEHPHLENFVQPPTAVGILNAFLAVAGNSKEIEELLSNAVEGELHELRSYLLQSKWFSEEQIDDKHIDVIKQLPVFQSYKSRKLVSLSSPSKWLKPNSVRDDLLDDNFVRVESERESFILRRYLDIKEPSRVEFYKINVLNRMKDFISQQGALSAILDDLKLLIVEDVSIKSALSTTAFILTGNGSWQQPSRLYDPRVPELQKLLHKEAFFPSDEFRDPEILETLVSLGLKRKLDFTGFIDCARSVSMLQDSGDLEAVRCGRKLVYYLDALAHKLSTKYGKENDSESHNTASPQSNVVPNGEEVVDDSSETHPSHFEDDTAVAHLLCDSFEDKPEEIFWSEIREIAWCPICEDAPVLGFPWLKSKKVASPSIVRPKSQMWMVSCSMYILDSECRSVYLQQKLGWMDSPDVNVLTTQLIELSKSHAQLKLHSSVRNDFEAALQIGIPTLYSALQKFLGTDNFVVLKSALDGVSWVWIGDDFVSPSALAFDSPVKYTPYLYVVPSELSEYRDLLLELGVRLSFDMWDYFCILQRLQNNVKGSPLSADQLNFVSCVLEVVADYCSNKPLSDDANSALLLPDFSGVLVPATDLVYNDAPWMDNNALTGKHFVHPTITNDLASRLGVKSLRCLSLVDKDITKDLPCMDVSKINELLALYGNNDFMSFDLLELADCCKARKLHLIFDKREHPRETLLQHNLGDFQGPALVAILEGVSLNIEAISSLQLLPPWKLRGDTLNYGLGLLSCYFLCDLLSIVSGGYFCMFDPQGLAIGIPSSHTPAAKMFPLIGTNLTERFSDQFTPMIIGQDMPWSSIDSTIIRMPLSLACLKDGLLGAQRVINIFDRFREHASRALLFLKSVFQVSLSTWEEGSQKPVQDYLVSIDSSSAFTRNPFSEKKWRKFQISRLFSSSNSSTKFNVVDVNLYQGANSIVDRWLIVLSLGSGQTRNMALDRRYLAHNLTPVAGVAAHISRNGHSVDVNEKSSVMSPLPLTGTIALPVSILGCFLVRHNGGRSLFKYQNSGSSAETHVDAGGQLIEAWNKELMSCVRDSYVEMVVEMQKLRKDPLSSVIEPSASHAIALSSKAYGDSIYSFWPRSNGHLRHESGDAHAHSLASGEVLKADWECVIEHVIRPFYARVVDLPLWQLYSGGLVKSDEGMFLSQPGNGVGGNLLPATVCSFVKEHYPVFSVPWELVSEIQAVGTIVREIKPKMVRDLLRMSSASIVLRSVDTYVDVLEYCLSDINFRTSSTVQGDDPSSSDSIQSVTNEMDSAYASTSMPNMQTFRGLPGQSSSSSGDALEMMTSLGKALFDFGRVVVEDIGRGGGPLITGNAAPHFDNGDPRFQSVADELKGLPCPTATNHLARLGMTELWFGNRDEQALMVPLAAKFINPKVLDRSILSDILSHHALQMLLTLKSFSLHLLASHMRLLFHPNWVNLVMNSNTSPWFSWENASSAGGEGGPSHEWIRIFWKNFSGSSEELSLFSDWPLIPAFLGRPILCRVKERNLVFIPPLSTCLASGSGLLDVGSSGSDVPGPLPDHTLESSAVQMYISAFEQVKGKYPWLFSLLNQWNISIFDSTFLYCAPSCYCLPTPGQSLGQVIACKLVAAAKAGYFSYPTSFSDPEREELFNLFANDFYCHGSSYGDEELEALRSLPIYKTVLGTHTRLIGQDQCMISSNSFLKPSDVHCLSYSTDSIEASLLRALGVPELHDQQILMQFGLPGFEGKPQTEQEDVLIYLYANWHDLQADSSLLDVLKETKFVRNADEYSSDLSRPKDLFDPCDSLLASVFSGERKKFPGERFDTDGWLRILRKAGLRTTTEVDVILDCARRVEFLGSECVKSMGDVDEFGTTHVHDEVPVEIWGLAGSVLETVFSNLAVLYGNNFCDLLSKISCVPAKLGFPNVGGKRVLTSYGEAVLWKDWPLAWSSSPIIARHVIPPEFSWGALHLRSPPVFSTVLKHLQVIGKNGGEDTLAHWPNSSGTLTVDEACCEVLKYLNNIWGSLSSSDVEQLRRVAFLPAANGTRLVMANSLFVHLTINLSPFAFELPGFCLPFVRILKDLGLQETLTATAAKDLLFHLQQSCGYQRLNPNELRAVNEVLYFLYDVVTKANMSDALDWKSDAIVPDDGCRLVHAKSCVYIDSYGSRYVKHIGTSRLRFVHPDLPERICRVLGIKKLSDIVIEELDPEQDLEILERVGSVPLALIREKLVSRSFQDAIWTLINSTASYIPGVNRLSLETVQKFLELVAENLQFVKLLHTRFLLLPQSLDITLVDENSILPIRENRSKHRSLYFVSQSKASIFVAEPPSYVSAVEVVAIVVSQVLGLSTLLPIGSLFLCPEGSENAVLNIWKLCSNKSENEPTSNKLIGQEILVPDALQVQLHPLRPFYMGEIVAWRSQNGEKLRYGRVPEDVKPSAGQALYRFKVEIEPGILEPLLSSQVFSFKSMSMGDDTSIATLPESGQTITSKGCLVEVPESSARHTTQYPQNLKETDYGRVSPAELVQAVDEMLTAAGISLDTEKQSLFQRTITLQEQLKESQAALLLEQEKADEAAKEAETAKAAWLCRVCLTNEVDITIVPCGHVLCRRCSSAVSRCPFCRVQVTKSIRIFRP